MTPAPVTEHILNDREVQVSPRQQHNTTVTNGSRQDSRQMSKNPVGTRQLDFHR